MIILSGGKGSAGTPGGGGGTTNFTMTDRGGAYNDPANATIFATTVGAILIAVIGNRNGIAHADHVLTDDSGGNTWTKVIGHDQGISPPDPDSRHAVSVWYKVVVSADTTSFVISADDGSTGSKGLKVVEIVPDAAKSWAYVDGAFADSGTADWNSTSSGNTPSLAGSDLLLVAVADARNGTAATAISFSTINSAQVIELRGTNQIGQAISIASTGQSGGVKETTITTTGSSGSEGAVGIVAFSG